ncbi:MAG: hypothetical protein AMXMBFR56_26700 [Polyangiaceae bacterium]
MLWAMRPEPSFARSVVAWGNACLRNELALEHFDTWWEKSGFVRVLSFRDSAEPAQSPATWLASQRAHGATRLLLEASDYAGSERVIVCAEVPLAAWRQQWTRIAGATAPPWFDATFSREAAPAVLPPPSRSPEEVLAELCAALEGLVALGTRANLEQWASYFEDVLGVARGERSQGTTPLPPTAPAVAHQLALAANLSDVFGGMGSWNDFQPLADPVLEDERSRHSSALHAAIRAALAATAHA